MTSTVHDKLTLIVRGGKEFWYRQEYKEMFGYYKALSLTITEPLFLRRVFINLGIAHEELSRIDEAIDSYMQALGINEELDTSDIALCRQNLGNALVSSGRLDEAFSFLSESEEYFRNSTDEGLDVNHKRDFRLGTTLETKARALHALGRTEEAKAAINEAIILLLTCCPDSKATDEVINTRGKIYADVQS